MVILALLALMTTHGRASTSIPLTIQEAIYPGGTTGIARTSDPVTVGIPLPDDASTGATNATDLTLSGATVGQFRVLGRWPSGRIKWALVDTEASVSAGATNTSVALTTGGTGNFGGSNLATDGTTISVDTGVAQFVVKKANFNGIDSAIVNGTTILASGASMGLVVTGPTAGNVTCGTCTTLYASANDASSTATIEENGPVKAIIKATGQHKDGSGNAYMRYTARLTFWKGLSRVRVVVSLQNADLGASSSFASAYKGFQAYEWRMVPSLSGTLSYAFGTHTGPSTGTITSTDTIYLYQAKTSALQWQDWCGFGCVDYTTDTGYTLLKNGSALVTGTSTQPSPGWADIANASGAGVSIGVEQLAGYYPKSLEFNPSNDVRIGIWARQNSQPYYQAWPQYSTHQLYLNFHDTALASPSNEFLKAQHYLVARAAYTQYNTAKVFPWTLIDPTVEDAFYTATRAAATPTLSAGTEGPILDYGTSSSLWPLSIYRFYAWHSGGGSNQTEFRWSHLLNFITRGMPGRYLDSIYFYRFLVDQGEPRSDAFAWSAQTGVIDGFGHPTATSTNGTLAFTNWRDQEHGHWYGMTDAYYMTGDELLKDAILDGFLDYHEAPFKSFQNGTIGGRNWTVNTVGTAVTATAGAPFTGADFYPGKSVAINGAAYFVASFTDATHIVLTTSAGTQSSQDMFSEGGLFNTRSIGVQLLSIARLGTFLQDQGDSTDATIVFANGDLVYNMMVKADLCTNGLPANCAVATIDGGPFRTEGLSRTRGVQWGAAGTSGTWCGVSHAYRVNSAFQHAILVGALMEYRRARGSGWSDYATSLDLAYGMSQYANNELAIFTSSDYTVNGFRFGDALDRENNCSGTGESPEPDFQITGNQTIWPLFLVDNELTGSTSWQSRAKIAMQQLMSSLGATTSDWGCYYISDMIARINGATPTLADVTISSFTDNGGGSYTLGWTVPSGVGSYRIKWGPKQIVSWIGFDPGTNAFIGNPTTTMNWFAAADLSAPSPGTAGATQNATVSVGTTGLSVTNFSLKGLSGSAPPVGGNRFRIRIIR